MVLVVLDDWEVVPALVAGAVVPGCDGILTLAAGAVKLLEEASVWTGTVMVSFLPTTTVLVRVDVAV